MNTEHEQTQSRPVDQCDVTQPHFNRTPLSPRYYCRHDSNHWIYNQIPKVITKTTDGL